MGERIPHVFHYCWFGGTTKPELIKRCIASWSKYHPDWEIKEWNESNFDVNSIPYTREAYQQKKWAFVADYARFAILYKYGGVFPDTDVEFLRRLPDDMLDCAGFMGFESDDRVAPGLIYGTIPNHTLTREIVEYYRNQDHFSENLTIGDITTQILQGHGLKKNGKLQTIEGVTIYPNDYFCCKNMETQMTRITNNTVSIHHYAASWVPWYDWKKIKSNITHLAVIILGEEKFLKLKRWKNVLTKD